MKASWLIQGLDNLVAFCSTSRLVDSLISTWNDMAISRTLNRHQKTVRSRYYLIQSSSSTQTRLTISVQTNHAQGSEFKYHRIRFYSVYPLLHPITRFTFHIPKIFQSNIAHKSIRSSQKAQGQHGTKLHPLLSLMGLPVPGSGDVLKREDIW